MKQRLAILILCFGLVVAATAHAQGKAPAPQTPPKTPAAAAPEEPRPVLAVPPGYHYDSRGRRDPFVNPIPKPPPGPKPDAPPPRPPGVKGTTVAEVSLVGVFIAKDPAMTRAILQVPTMKAPVLASVGDVLFDAVIKEIRMDSVVFKMFPPGKKPSDATGNQEEVKKLRTAGEKK